MGSQGSAGSQDLTRASAGSLNEDAKRAARALNAQHEERAAAAGAFQGKGGGKRSLPWEGQQKQLSGNKLKKQQWQKNMTDQWKANRSWKKARW